MPRQRWIEAALVSMIALTLAWTALAMLAPTSRTALYDQIAAIPLYVYTLAISAVSVIVSGLGILRTWRLRRALRTRVPEIPIDVVAETLARQRDTMRAEIDEIRREVSRDFQGYMREERTVTRDAQGRVREARSTWYGADSPHGQAVREEAQRDFDRVRATPAPVPDEPTTRRIIL